MQFLDVPRNMTLLELNNTVGARNVDSILHINNTKRVPKIGEEFYSVCQNAIEGVKDIDWQRKASLLNTMTDDSDVFETAALMGNTAWRVYSVMNTFPGKMRIPDGLVLKGSENLIGDGIHLSRTVYETAMEMLRTYPHVIDPGVFNEYSTIKPSRILTDELYSTGVFQWFRIPWGEVTLYSSLSDSAIDFPVFPEELGDAVHANYTTMPDLIYQYEPWQLYTGSGPRSNTYTFDFHRDMWTGDHNDGKANQLIRFCMANCYPDYNGAAVNTSLVTLYIHGYKLIEGVLTDVGVSWDGPLGHDYWYLHCKLELSITEVSPIPLNHTTMLNKPLIG